MNSRRNGGESRYVAQSPTYIDHLLVLLVRLTEILERVGQEVAVQLVRDPPVQLRDETTNPPSGRDQPIRTTRGWFPGRTWLAWIAQPLAACDDDHVLTNATIYWLTNTGASSARFYYEDHHAEHPTAPTGLASFAWDFTPLRRFADRDHANIVSWNEYDRGGHWSAQDAPDLLVDDMRAFFRTLR